MFGYWLTLVSTATLIISAALLTAMILARFRPLAGAGRQRQVQRPLVVKPSPPPVAPVRRPGGDQILDSRIQEMEAQLRLLAERQDRFDLRSNGEQPYRLAIRLARKGAAVSEIASTCGLTRSEAELITALHCGGNGAASMRP